MSRRLIFFWTAPVLAVFALVGWILVSEMAAARTLSGPGMVELKVELGGPIDLIDGDGAPVTEDRFSGNLALIYFGYTYCPDVCATSVQTLAEVMDDLAPSEAAQLSPIFVTVDPMRDTPEAVREYAAAFHPEMTGLTGAPKAVESVAKSFRVLYRVNNRGRGDDYLVDHSSYYYLMDRDWGLAAVFKPEATPEQIVAVVRQML